MAVGHALAEKQDFIKSARKTKNENNGKGSTLSRCCLLWRIIPQHMVIIDVGYILCALLVFAV